MKNIVTGSSGLLDSASKRQWGEVPGDRREGPYRRKLLYGRERWDQYL